MGHFAKIENNLVTEIIVINNSVLQDKDFPESESIGQKFIASIGLDGEWRQTSYNANFRGKYAGFSDIYNEELDIFETPNFSVEE
jgi:hypothetical protein